jgi:hypothetical protein
MAVELITNFNQYIGTNAERLAMDTYDVPAGSTFYEYDTGDGYTFANSDWHLVL